MGKIPYSKYLYRSDDYNISDLRSKFNEIKRWCEKHGKRYFEISYISPHNSLFDHTYTLGITLDIESDLDSINPETVDRVYTVFKKHHGYIDKILEVLNEDKTYFVRVENDDIIIHTYSRSDKRYELQIGVYTPEKDLLLIFPRLIYVYYFIDVYISMDDLISALVMS